MPTMCPECFRARTHRYGCPNDLADSKQCDEHQLSCDPEDCPVCFADVHLWWGVSENKCRYRYDCWDEFADWLSEYAEGRAFEVKTMLVKDPGYVVRAWIHENLPPFALSGLVRTNAVQHEPMGGHVDVPEVPGGGTS